MCVSNSYIQVGLQYTIPQVLSGVQAILPYYEFQCESILNQVIVQVLGGSTQFDLQIWRASGK